jgi:hypothetical protein
MALTFSPFVTPWPLLAKKKQYGSIIPFSRQKKTSPQIILSAALYRLLFLCDCQHFYG